MKKLKLFIILILIAVFCQGQSPKWVTLNINYFPNDVFETNNFQLEGSYMFGLAENFIRFGGVIRSDNKFEHMSIGLENQLLILPGMIDVNVVAGIGINTNQTNEDLKGGPHRKHYIEVGPLFRYASTETISMHWSFKIQQYNKKVEPYYSLGASYNFN